MAKTPMGYGSPFNKLSSIKASPAKVIAPWMIQAGIAAAPGIISAVGSLFGRKKRKAEQRAARDEMAQAKQAFMDIEYKNPYENLTNPYANMENVYEDATVDTQSADYLREQQQQSQANIMQGLKGVAGSSGVAGLAQSMSNVATGQARQASAGIAQQERANQQRAMGESARLEGLERQGQFGVDKMQAQGELYKRQQENARTGSMYGLSIDRADAADSARSTARSNFIGGLGQAAAGVAGLYAPGGSQFGTNPFGGGNGSGGAEMDYENFLQQPDNITMDPNQSGFNNTNRPYVTPTDASDHIYPQHQGNAVNITTNPNPYGIG